MCSLPDTLKTRLKAVGLSGRINTAFVERIKLPLSPPFHEKASNFLAVIAVVLRPWPLAWLIIAGQFYN